MNKSIKLRLIVMNIIQWAVWGAYLTSMGSYLASVGLATRIGIFYSMQGIVSIFMPTLMGIVADKFIPAQKLLGLCHGIAGAAMAGAGLYGMSAGSEVSFGILFGLYAVSVAFYMPTIALSNTVAFGTLTRSGFDFVKAFPPIRTLGTVGFIASMWLVNSLSFGLELTAQQTYMQLVVCGVLGLLLGLYSFTLPQCPLSQSNEKKSIAQRLGLDAFKLFKSKQMAMFFIFSMLLGVSLQITNGFATPFIESFSASSNSWFAENPTMLVSLSQISEALCILLTSFFLIRFGIKKVMLIAMFAWVLRFGFFALFVERGGFHSSIYCMIHKAA